MGQRDHLPEVSSLTNFRTRLGSDGLERLYQELLRQPRTHGLVRDRLRIKDATHVLADIAVPATLQLLTQARDRLLQTAQPFAPERVAGGCGSSRSARMPTAWLRTCGCWPASITLLPANGDETADTLALLNQEQLALGNALKQLSIDGAGYDGPLPRELAGPRGRNRPTFVPPRKKARETFARQTSRATPCPLRWFVQRERVRGIAKGTASVPRRHSGLSGRPAPVVR